MDGNRQRGLARPKIAGCPLHAERTWPDVMVIGYHPIIIGWRWVTGPWLGVRECGLPMSPSFVLGASGRARESKDCRYSTAQRMTAAY